MPVVGYEGFYEVSDGGEVRSIDRTIDVKSRSGGIHQRHYRGMISDENTHIRRNGRRQCRACDRRRHREHKARLVAA